ncbi:MAG: type III-B CRISPR module RAMP protein Cmr4 [Candidatus Nanoarchaeia archaeon]|nr:type III-B CRISPR module RAMP protein Cmr4 [Candidatus Jingweiarchaeum tengchongense]
MNNLNLQKVFGRALDPIHIGAGGYRLGRVDNTIVRDPATDLPKIPGTSISGVMREFYTVYLMESDNECKNKSSEKEKRECAEEKVKAIFGDENQKGILRFYDGQIVFFPVSSIQGIVWITTKELLEYWLGELKDRNEEAIKIPTEIENEAYAIKGIDDSKPLNLGWLLFSLEKIKSEKGVVLPSKMSEWVKRIVLVSEKLFSHIVNDSLEVRTSVRIDPQTGTAAERALFTYEAIPRGTVLGFEIVEDNILKNRRNTLISIDNIITVVSPYFRLLGIGGMGTRGFGRIELVVNSE